MVATVWSTSDSPYTCLKDTERTLAFREAINQVVRPGDIVVDAGAGTGILSFFAVEAGAGRVYAVELDPGLVKSLRLSVALNGLDERIVVVAGDALQVELPGHVDVFIGEVIETGLIEEMQVAVVNALRERGVIDPKTRLIPERYETFVELVEVDDRFYGFRIVAPFHEWPNYDGSEEGWHATSVRPLTCTALVTEVDLTRPVEPVVRRSLDLNGIAAGEANGVRVSGVAHLSRNIALGQTNALNGDKILHLDPPVRVRPDSHIPFQVSFVMSGGLGSFNWRL